jgi:hypothetical protein
LSNSSSLVYRARNNAKDIVAALRQGGLSVGQPLARLRSQHVSIEDLLYEERALLPEVVFLILHKLKHAFLHFIGEVDGCLSLDSAQQADAALGPIAAIQRSCDRLNQLHDELVSCIQAYLGVNHDLGSG